MNFKNLLLPLTLLASLSVSASPFFYAGPVTNDVDNAIPTTFDITVSDFGVISDLNLYLDFNFIGLSSELEINLSHAGTTVLVADNISFAGGGVTFDDELTTPPTPTAPSNSLSAFDGLDINGIWTLSIADNSFFTGDGDDLAAWNINGDLTAPSGGVPTPSVLWLLGAALFGLVGLRRKTTR